MMMKIIVIIVIVILMIYIEDVNFTRNYLQKVLYNATTAV